jgi:putative DNA primase/helicase
VNERSEDRSPDATGEHSQSRSAVIVPPLTAPGSHVEARVPVRHVPLQIAEGPTAGEASTLEPTRTDLGNAERFAAAYVDRLRFVKERRQWIEWRDGRWRPDRTGEAERAAKGIARQLLRDAAELEGAAQDTAVRFALASASEARLRAMITLAGTEPALVLPADALDRNPYLLACGNGVLELQTGTLMKPDPDDLVSLGTDIDYDPAAPCTRWLRFLDEVFNGDEELVDYVGRAIGYSLTGDTREQVVFVAHGHGCNGKDTLVRVVLRIVGEHGQTAPFETFVRARGDRGVRNDIARLHRARFVVASESGEGKRLDEALVKVLSGGGRLAARFLYGEFFEFVPMFKLLLVTNHTPRVDGDDDAIWRRIRLLPFRVSFLGREDKTLDRQLEAELPGILAWAVERCLEWQQEGLGLPPAVADATAAYRAEEDVVGAFLAERCQLEGDIEPAILREAYEQFCDAIGEKPLASAILGKRLRRRGIRRRTRDGHSVYDGLSLR